VYANNTIVWWNKVATDSREYGARGKKKEREERGEEKEKRAAEKRRETRMWARKRREGEMREKGCEEE